MRVTRPRTAPIELATSSRARIGTTVVARAAALAPQTASAAVSSASHARAQGGRIAAEPCRLGAVVRGMPRQNSGNGSGFSS
jgi:hypothetical protein